MIKEHHVFYIETIVYYLHSIDMSIERVNKEMIIIQEEEIQGAQFELHVDNILNGLQDIVIQSSNISKLFWPVRKEKIYRDRADKLREVFEITDKSPFKNRDLRNTLEHFDERLDVFLENIPVGTIYPKYLGSYEKVNDPSFHFFRAYFVDISTFQILNTKIKVDEIIDEVNRLKKQVMIKVDSKFQFTQ
jgi:hypothetical protein